MPGFPGEERHPLMRKRVRGSSGAAGLPAGRSFSGGTEKSGMRQRAGRGAAGLESAGAERPPVGAPDGDLILKLIDMRFWSCTHTMAGAAMALGISDRTASR